MIRHDAFDELVVGYALHALEPADEALLLTHLPSCSVCRVGLDEASATASELAFLSLATDVPSSLLDGIRHAITRTPEAPRLDAAPTPSPVAVDSPVVGAPVDELAARRSRRAAPGWLVRAAASAAAAALVVASGAAASLWAANSRNHATASSYRKVVSELVDPGASLVPLAGAPDSPDSFGQAIVRGRRVTLVSANLGAWGGKGGEYVLWANGARGGVVPVIGFAVNHPGVQVVTATLPAGAASTPTLFAVSRETMRTLPTRPALVVMGAVSS